jgi:hypothetical protein
MPRSLSFNRGENLRQEETEIIKYCKLFFLGKNVRLLISCVCFSIADRKQEVKTQNYVHVDHVDAAVGVKQLQLPNFVYRMHLSCRDLCWKSLRLETAGA